MINSVSDQIRSILWTTVVIVVFLFVSAFAFIMLAKAQVRIVNPFGEYIPHVYSWTPYHAWLDSIEQQYYPSVPEGIDQACAEGESGYDTTAIRFEPDYKKRYGVTIRKHSVAWCKKHKHIRSIETEFDQRCYSYHEHQNMGENLREAGFDEPTIAYISSEQDIAMFYRTFDLLLTKYKAKHHVHHVTRECFLDACAAYNGGPGAVKGGGHYRNWDYVTDKEQRLARIRTEMGLPASPDWGHF